VSLRDLLATEPASIEAIAVFLDRLSHAERLDETRTLGRDAQRRLYRAAKRAAPLTLDDFVPLGVAQRVAVRHHGRNTLPLPASLRLFEKRFARPEQGEGTLYGYNQSPFLSTIGPGFFVAVSTAGKPDWEERGGVVVDYFQVPAGPVPDGWPEVVPNTRGLQRFVYHETRDYLRKVSEHVTIGAAYKVEQPLDHYFVLCRED
jgi:hypothetical protein